MAKTFSNLKVMGIMRVHLTPGVSNVALSSPSKAWSGWMLGHLLMPVQQEHLLVRVGVSRADSFIPRLEGVLEPHHCDQTPAPRASSAVRGLSA